jgi:parallel beta-helix repeat protein
MKILHFLIATIVFLASCSGVDSYDPERNFVSIENELREQLYLVEDSGVIELPEGHFLFKKSLILDGKSHVTIRGAGMDKTVLSFKGQIEGAEGLRISNGENITIENLTVEDASGDNIKVTDTKGITIRNVKVAWTGDIDSENGAYGLYPVLCSDVLIEGCEAMGASDAGIYVGQSNDVIIRRNKAYQNVAGIESENSVNVAIYENEAFDNTGGLLIFDLPGLTMYGAKVKAFNNKIVDNNRENFAPPGNIVATVPPGTGVMILATRDVDIFSNEVIDNRTVGLAVISYELVAALSSENEGESNAGSAQRVNTNFENDSSYYPYPVEIRIGKNNFENSYTLPSFSHDIGKLIFFKFPFSTPNILYDGIRSGNDKEVPICLKDPDVSFADLDAANDFENIQENTSEYICK